MDIARPSFAGQRRRRQILYGAVGIVLVGLVTMGVYRLKPAAYHQHLSRAESQKPVPGRALHHHRKRRG